MRSLRLFLLPVMAGGGLLLAQTYNTHPRPQSYNQAVQFEKEKDRRAAATARAKADPFDQMSNADRSADRSMDQGNTVGDRGERKTMHKGAAHRKTQKNQ